MTDTKSKLTNAEYLALEPEQRAMVRCFSDLANLPPVALEDMRSLSIQGSSLARQIVDGKSGLLSVSMKRQAQRMIAYYETRSQRV